MAKDIQELIVSVGQRGMADLERTFKNLDGVVGNSLEGLSRYNRKLSEDSSAAETQVKAIHNTLTTLERGIASAGKGLSTTFDGRQIAQFDTKLRGMRRQLDKTRDALEGAALSGDKATERAMRTRLGSIQKTIDAEVSGFSKLYTSHREQFEQLSKLQKRGLGQNVAAGGKGAANLISQVSGGNLKGAAGTLGQAGKVGFQSAQRRAFAGAAGGSAGAAGLSSALGGLAKIAGPLAAVAAVVGSLVKAFLDLDAKVKDVNKSMLKNVPLTSLAADGFSDMNDKIADGENALADFRNTVLTDADLRMLGMTPEMMASTMAAIEEQAGGLSQLRREGFSARDALEAAQIAALNLGVDSNETMGLVGQLMDVTSASTGEALSSLSQIVSTAQDAGVSTRKFFQVVQGVVGEMGLYNYRLEETAALFGKLTTIMDSKSAESFATSLSSAIKNASATDRTRTSLIVGSKTMGEMTDRAQAAAASGINEDVLANAMRKLGLGAQFQSGNVAGSMGGLSERQRLAVMSAVSDEDQGQGERLRKFENLRGVNRNNAMEVQGAMGDFNQYDQMATKIMELEKSLSMPLSQMNSVLTEGMGTNEDQLRIFKTIQGEGKGDMARLQMLLEKGVGGSAFSEAAKEMGYIVSEENGKILDSQGNEIKSFNQLFATMDDEKAKDLQEKQKTLAEKQSDLQRTMLDTIKFQLMDLVQGIYTTILDIYDALVNSKFFGGSQESRDRSAMVRKEMKTRDQIRTIDQDLGLAREQGDSGRVRELEAQREALKSSLDTQQRARRHLKKSGSLGMAGATALASGDPATGGLSYEYSGGMGRRFEEDEYSGLTMGDSKLTGIVTSSGKRITGEDAIKAFVAEQEKNKKAAQGTIGSLIQSKVDDGEELYPEDAKNLAEKTNNLLESKGILLAPKTIKDLTDVMLQAQIDKQVVSEIMRTTGRSKADSEFLLGKYKSGDEAAINQVGKEGNLQGIFANYGVQTARDARIVTGGIPLLDLQPGDIVVDQSMLANAVAGGAGQFVPDLLRSAGNKAGPSSSSDSTLNANFYINGGNPGEIRTEIMRVLEQWQNLGASRG